MQADFVIVGSGSAGSAMASRLSEDGKHSVIVLEFGGSDFGPFIQMPAALAWPMSMDRYNWGYLSEPEPQLNNRRITAPRGKVIGGSSSINAMAYVRGNRGDFDRWAASGLAGWSYAHVLPYFRRQESWQGGPSYYRGGEGPLATQLAPYADPLVEAFAAAGRDAGHPATPDYNGARQEGFGVCQMTIRNGRRCSAADAYLRPALGRPNLRVEILALTTRVVIEGGRAVGVEYVRGGRVMTARANREVVLCGGVINSPQLLMLSGIGDPDALRALGIEVNMALRGVGKNLQDHISAAVVYKRKGRGPLHKTMRFDRIVRALAAAHFRGTGLATNLPTGVMAFLKTQPDVALPDIQLLFNAAPMTAAPYLFPFKRAYEDAYACRAVVLRPQSRGAVELVSDDPAAAPRIRQNFLATESDWKTLRAGLRIARDVCRQPVMAPFMDREIAPGANALDDADFDAHIRANGITVHHPLGTCKMGIASDRMAVVDPELRVHGIAGLRVVDGSVMPDLVGANINAPIIMMAEKAADLIRGKPPLEPARVAATSEARS
ncbi:MAG: choline dehydrogenase [Xanthobacteraceae bacterium]|nr:choline dehydrogenase [Xanthobacteraceae bacterium]